MSRELRKSVEKRKYGDSEDEGLFLSPGYPGTPPPDPEHGWIPFQAAKVKDIHEVPPGGVHPPMAEDPVDIRRLELLVGRIKYARIHPTKPCSWMLTYVDVGFKFPISIVSSIGKYYDKKSLERRKVVALCNIEPMEGIRNIGNTAALMCGAAPDPSDPENIIYELWDVPKKARVGDPLRCENYPLKADMLSPQKPFIPNDEMIIEEIFADMKINSSRQVTYKDEKLYVRGLKGQYITTKTLADCGLKATLI